MIGSCECCERQNVPILSCYNDKTKVFVCFLCQVEYDPDPEWNIEGSISWNEWQETNGQFGVGA